MSSAHGGLSSGCERHPAGHEVCMDQAANESALVIWALCSSGNVGAIVRKRGRKTDGFLLYSSKSRDS